MTFLTQTRKDAGKNLTLQRYFATLREAVFRNA